MTTNKILITCPKQISGILAEEVEALGMTVTAKGMMDVALEGTMEDCMRLNLHLRTGHRVLWLVKSFTAGHPDLLYTEINNI
nr:THUMP domain-containing protein [Bacteroidota bacterium]